MARARHGCTFEPRFAASDGCQRRKFRLLEFQERSPKRGHVEPGAVEHRFLGSIPRSDARLADFYGGRGEQQPRQPLAAAAGDGERDPVITGRVGGSSPSDDTSDATMPQGEASKRNATATSAPPEEDTGPARDTDASEPVDNTRPDENTDEEPAQENPELTDDTSESPPGEPASGELHPVDRDGHPGKRNGSPRRRRGNQRRSRN